MYLRNNQSILILLDEVIVKYENICLFYINSYVDSIIIQIHANLEFIHIRITTMHVVVSLRR